MKSRLEGLRPEHVEIVDAEALLSGFVDSATSFRESAEAALDVAARRAASDAYGDVVDDCQTQHATTRATQP